MRIHETPVRALNLPTRCLGLGQICSLRFPTPEAVACGRAPRWRDRSPYPTKALAERAEAGWSALGRTRHRALAGVGSTSGKECPDERHSEVCPQERVEVPALRQLDDVGGGNLVSGMPDRGKLGVTVACDQKQWDRARGESVQDALAVVEGKGQRCQCEGIGGLHRGPHPRRTVATALALSAVRPSPTAGPVISRTCQERRSRCTAVGLLDGHEDYLPCTSLTPTSLDSRHLAHM